MNGISGKTNCHCCLSKVEEQDVFFIKGFRCCPECGFVFASVSPAMEHRRNIVAHYKVVDPHDEVGEAKKTFFSTAVQNLAMRLDGSQRRILDVGCGFGFFLERALNKGWDARGIELVDTAVRAAREKVGQKNIFQGTLREAEYQDEIFDAVTVWDVLVMVDDPYAELEECFRVLRKGGILGMRVRNVRFQVLAYRIYSALDRIFRALRVKRFSVFHKYCFSPKSIEALLKRAGFTKIRIENSPLTKGDPYNYTRVAGLVSFFKLGISALTGVCYSISGGKWVLGPSLLVWARKPE